jgi:hypothetical protein
MNHVKFPHVHHDDLLTGMVESSSKEHFVSFFKNVEQKKCRLRFQRSENDSRGRSHVLC